LPYTDDDEANTTRRTLLRRAASSTFRKPEVFTSCVVKGSATERGTEHSAAWWKIASTPCTAAQTVSKLRMSPSMSLMSGFVRLVRLPVEKLSSTTTSCCCAAN